MYSYGDVYPYMYIIRYEEKCRTKKPETENKLQIIPGLMRRSRGPDMVSHMITFLQILINEFRDSKRLHLRSWNDSLSGLNIFTTLPHTYICIYIHIHTWQVL